MVLQLISPSTQLDAIGSFKAGASIADSIAQRNQEQQRINMEQEKYNYLKAQQQEQAQKQAALQQIAVTAFNNPDALKMVYAQDRELGDSIAKQRDKYNQVTASVINDVTKAPAGQERQAAWARSRSYLEKNGFNTDDLPEKYDDLVHQNLLQKQKELKTWDDTFKTIETTQGTMLQSEKTGQVSPANFTSLENKQQKLDFEKTKADITKIYDDIAQNKVKLQENGGLTEKEKGAEQVSYIGERMKELYNKLDESGGIINPEKGVWHNLGARVRSGSWTGQVVGKAVGTEEQSARREIDNLRNQAKIAIMQATGMSAKAFDSNTEAKALLDSLGSPDQDIKSSLNAVQTFVDRYGKKSYEYKSPDKKSGKTNTGQTFKSSSQVINWGDLK